METKHQLALVVLILIILITCPTLAFAQKKKEIREAGIKQKIEWRYIYENEKEIKYKEYEAQFDKQGNILMEKNYDEKGNTVKHIEYKYDGEGNEILQTTFNSKGEVLERVETTYSNGFKVEKKVYGPNGKLKSRKVFE
ncbi:MAG TPA: hypothetical protein PK049_11455, partial [Tenuifilum sp.]|nr:hypothetical protein [Tenuifilum sp.]